MNNIAITHELCAEDRKRIDTLTEALSRLAESLPQVTAFPGIEIKAEEIQLPMAAVDQPAPKKEEPQTPTHTKDEVRKLVVTLSANGKKDMARAIVMANGKSITDLPDESIDIVYNALKALEEQA